ncbi:MAG: 50S ribosomal protein L17 [Desulfuromonas sp.]|nr:MAG: 50S ribosomal protein L17 [Desulfuromonas sp.]
MRNNKSGRRLGRNPSHRTAMMRNMVTSLIQHERITTTDTRAKELRKIADKMITLGKRGDLHARRQALQVIQDKQVVAMLFERIAPRYADRPGGYTRIIKVANRPGDNAPMAVIELVEEEFTAKPKKAKPVEVQVAKPVAEEAATEEVAEEAATEEVAEEAATEEVAEEAATEENKQD